MPVAGTTSYIDSVFLQDSTSTTGAGKTGLLFSDVTCYYKRANGTAGVAVTLANITTFGTYVSGGFKEVDATNMPGYYEFHPPNAALAAGVGVYWSDFYFKGAGVAPTVMRIPMGAYAIDPSSITSFWDEILTAATHNITNSAGKMLRLGFLRFFPLVGGRTVKDRATHTIKLIDADGTTVITTQDYLDDGSGNETLGAAT